MSCVPSRNFSRVRRRICAGRRIERIRRRRWRLGGAKVLRRGLDDDRRRATGIAEDGRCAEARRHHPHRPQRSRAAGPRRREHPDRTELGGRPARGKEGRSCDHHQAAGGLDPARGREEERQAFRGRDALPRRRGQGHAVPRHRERLRRHGRRRPRPGRGRRLQDRPDRAGDAGPARHRLCRSGNAGLSLGGSGTLQPIQHGQPRASSVDRVPVPRNGLTAPGKPGPASLQHAGLRRTAARRDPDFVLARRGAAERPPCHPRPRAQCRHGGRRRAAPQIAKTRLSGLRRTLDRAAPVRSASERNGSGGSGNSASGNGGNGGSAGGGSSGGSGRSPALLAVGGAVGGVVGRCRRHGRRRRRRRSAASLAASANGWRHHRRHGGGNGNRRWQRQQRQPLRRFKR